MSRHTEKSRVKAPTSRQVLIASPGRYETLQTLIFELFGETDLEEAHHDPNSPYDGFVVEMFTVEEVRKNQVVLKHFYNDDLFDPVYFPDCIRDVLEPGDLFLVSLGLGDERWFVTWMSPMYH